MFFCGDECCELLEKLKVKFACAISLKSLNWQEIVTHLKSLNYDDLCQHQILLLNTTVHHPVIKKYPIKKSYQKEFLKKFVNKLEKHNLLAHDLIYEALITLLSNDNEDIHYKHFIIGNRYLSLKENTCFISQGTTGLITWQAGVALANWAINNGDLLKDKQILELGCGIGLTGLAVIFSGTPIKSYTFTDYHPLVLKNLEYNINLNCKAPRNSFPRKITGIEVNVLNIDWETINKIKFDHKTFDLIIAADVIYDSRLSYSFCKALNLLIGTSNKVAIIACTERDPETYKKFKNILEEFSLTVINEFYECATNSSLLQYTSETPVIISTVKSLMSKET